VVVIWLTTNLFKLTSAALLAVCVVLFVLFRIELAANSELSLALAQARTNEATLSGAIAAQNDRIAALSAESARRTKRAKVAMAAAKPGVTAAERRAAEILAYRPKGADECARLRDVDARLLDGLP